MLFKDRFQAGQLLYEKLSSYSESRAIVFGLARGGVVVASAIAHALQCELDVLVVKKIPSPMDPELAIGAIAPDGISFIDWKLARHVGADETYVARVISQQSSVVRDKSLLYRKGRKPIDIKKGTVTLVDDGAATGATMEAAVAWAKNKHAKRIIVALPVATREFVKRITPEVSDLVVLDIPENFSSVGQFYQHFAQVTDEEVMRLLGAAKDVR